MTLEQTLTEAKFCLDNPDVTHTPGAHRTIIAGLLAQLELHTKGSKRAHYICTCPDCKSEPSRIVTLASKVEQLEGAVRHAVKVLNHHNLPLECMPLHAALSSAPGLKWELLDADEAAALTAMVYGAPWLDTYCQALVEVLDLYEKLRAKGQRPVDPADNVNELVYGEAVLA